jgi:hypothetical protein
MCEIYKLCPIYVVVYLTCAIVKENQNPKFVAVWTRHDTMFSPLMKLGRWGWGGKNTEQLSQRPLIPNAAIGQDPERATSTAVRSGWISHSLLHALLEYHFQTGLSTNTLCAYGFQFLAGHIAVTFIPLPKLRKTRISSICNTLRSVFCLLRTDRPTFLSTYFPRCFYVNILSY